MLTTDDKKPLFIRLRQIDIECSCDSSDKKEGCEAASDHAELLPLGNVGSVGQLLRHE